MSTLKVLGEVTTDLASKAVTTVQESKWIKGDGTGAVQAGGGSATGRPTTGPGSWGFIATGAVDLWKT